MPPDAIRSSSRSKRSARRERTLPQEPYDVARLIRVLQTAARDAQWGARLPRGRGRGIACCFANGSYVAQVVEVTARTPERIHVDRVVCVFDCGVVVNRGGAEAQVQGSIAQGISTAFLEEITVKEGRVEQSGLGDYPVLRMPQTPRVEVRFIEDTEAPGGLGEPALPPVIPAVANAIFAATGKRMRVLPFKRGGVGLV